MAWIYKITSPSGKIYIGSSINVEQRFYGYKNRNSKCQPKLNNSFKKYGVENHIFEIVTECTIEEMYELEAFYGLQFDVLGKNGLNCLLPKKGDIKCAVSDETRQKQSKASKGNTYRRGKKMRPESIEKIRLRKIGSKATPETKAKMSKAQKGKPKTKTERKISEAHKKAISDCNKNRVRKTGYKMPQHAIEKMKIRMAGNQYGKGAKHTPEMNKKKSETTKSQPGSLKALEARNKLVLNTQTGIYYDTAKEAAETQTRWNKKYIHNMLGGYKKNNSPFIYV